MPFGVKGLFQAAAIVGFAYEGFDAITTLAEETKKPSRDIPIGLLGSMSVITVIYCLIALSLSMMQKYTDIDPNAAYSVAFESVGMNWAKYLVAFGALKGMTTVVLVAVLAQARYTMHIARAHMIPPWFVLVHPKTRTPIYATLMMTTGSAVIAFFSSLDVLAGLLAVSNCFLSTLLPVALLVRRYYVTGITPRANVLKFVALLLLVLLSSAATSAYWALTSTCWIGYTITLPLWFLGTLGMSVLLPLQRTPRVWGVPLVPWFPSLAIVTNLFLMGSLDASAFIRFGICTVMIMVYYFFFGLHATYDMAHEPNKPESMKIANTDSETPFQFQNLEI
ncbi:hypothetical protein RHSIM_Rhsim02G0170900 [Rhododendron simsii]|uniref:Cationic amino acid transporter C-terminal domain-containing protein n=1 Tax=Rhododendron simsii TaxID=118357 RepID=A0A834HF16_RHOSS|nr:hypothetical protein RHSIM_Rhsim02G0170900 [Rhododendron simsii]